MTVQNADAYVAKSHTGEPGLHTNVDKASHEKVV